MENYIQIAYLNDFIFCPLSIYYHKLCENFDDLIYKSQNQLDGKFLHKKIENKKYSTSLRYVQELDVYSSKYNLVGKIDILDLKTNTLIERKRKINKIYDGLIFQLYGQYYSLKEMGYKIKKLKIHSMLDNKNYYIKLPKDDLLMKNRFDKLINSIINFDIQNYKVVNQEKCKNCLYSSICRGSII
jgi:CRISPR-associated exonuclease Cas4